MEETQNMQITPQKVQTGVQAIDLLFDGGLPQGSNILLYGDPMCGKKLILMRYIYEGLKSQIPAIFILTDFGHEEWKIKMQQLGMDIDSFEKSGYLKIIDCYSKQFDPSIQNTQSVKFADNASALSNISLLISSANDELSANFGSYRLAFHSLSSLVEGSNQKDFYKFMQFHVGKFRKNNAICLFAMEKGMHNLKEVITVEHLMNGTIEFEGFKLRPKGLGAKSQWWDYTINDNGVEVISPNSGSNENSQMSKGNMQAPFAPSGSKVTPLSSRLKFDKQH